MDRAQWRFRQLAPQARAICRALADELVKLGFAPGSVPIGDPDAASYRLDRDPASGLHSLVGEWRDAKGQKQGGLVFHADGTFFVEYDVIRVHPRGSPLVRRGGGRLGPRGRYPGRAAAAARGLLNAAAGFATGQTLPPVPWATSTPLSALRRRGGRGTGDSAPSD